MYVSSMLLQDTPVRLQQLIRDGIAWQDILARSGRVWCHSQHDDVASMGVL